MKLDLTPPVRRTDLNHSPFIVFFETTRACDLACRHCRASAIPTRSHDELSFEQFQQLAEQLMSFPIPPMLVLTGGDPLKRPDIFQIISAARNIGLRVAMTPSATPFLTTDAIDRMARLGLERLALSIDGADAQTHDDFRGVEGSFDRTLRIMTDARTRGLSLQVNTTITRHNVDQIDDMATQVAQLGIDLWSVFFLVPVGRGQAKQSIDPETYEQVFAKLWHHAQTTSFGIKTTEAHHYRRYVLKRFGNPQSNGVGSRRAPLGISDGKGVCFISHKGHIYPSGFLPLECGRFPNQSIVDVYQNHSTFKQLRDTDELKGKCGRCEFRNVCGGSRARAYALTGDPLESDTHCVYEPAPT
jgi:radical SAM protein with 4Fe4S-binding SPASM domain